VSSCSVDTCFGGDLDVGDRANGGDSGAGGLDVGPGNPDMVIEPGEFGAPCGGDEECISNFCIVGLEGRYICTERCFEDDDCPAEGYSCQFVESTGADLVEICYPVIFDLCKPCEEDFECGGLADRCVALNDGTFCGSDCTRSESCPDGYDCRVFGESHQCAPASSYCSDCFDRDGDGYGVGALCLGLDCDDEDQTTYWGAPELCDFQDNDCDNVIDNGIDVTTNADHCGGCGQACDLPNAVNICVASTCYIESCLPGFYDIDPDEPGCEYECTFENLGIVDVPDAGPFMDTNCDGVDGDANSSIFVSASAGHPDGLGTRDDPVDSIWKGIELAVASSFDDVLIAQGTYTGQEIEPGRYAPVEVVQGIGLHGGYDARNWSRSEERVTLVLGSATPLVAFNITEETVLSRLDVQADTGRSLASGDGATSIALLAVNASGLVIANCSLQAGDGGVGLDGDVGVKGADGENGGVGGTGTVSSSGLCPSNSPPARGLPGPSSCSPGGRGGLAGHSEDRGGTGASVGSVAGGGGGRGGTNDFWNGADDPGEPGQAGCDLAGSAAHCTSLPAPTNGRAGDGGDGVGTVDDDGFWRGKTGEPGGDGGDGNGGGGGGGGGGATGLCGGFTSSCDGYGGGGGGGGGGGCGGSGGEGGGAGGGSFALYLVDSEPTVLGGTLTSRSGGVGGSGGQAGSAGRGGGGGSGGGSNCNGGTGGRGGDGSDGGDGGHGGGGGGGVSFAIFLVDSSDSFFEDVDTIWGIGGEGGFSRGNTGTRGESGAIRRVTR
jgi:hypothetical protein